MSSDALRGLVIGLDIGVEIIFFTDDRAASRMWGKNALETVAINIQVRDEGEGGRVGEL